MQFKILLALFASVLLIGATSWQRFSNSSEAIPTLTAVERSNIRANGRDISSEPLTSSASQETIPSISNTDLIGRGLLSNYLGAAADGEVNASTIDTIVSQYVDSVPNLIKAPTITADDLNKITGDNKNDLYAYSIALSRIYIKHEPRVNDIYRSKTANPSAESYYAGFGQASAIYQEIAEELKKLPVPAFVAPQHAELINIELLTATAAKAIGDMDKDPATGFAGFVTINANLDKEPLVIANIRATLKSHGI